MLTLQVTGVRPNEFRVYGSTVYTNFAVTLARPDGVPVETRAQDWQFDTAKYPEIAAHVEALLPLLTGAYLFEASMLPDPGQTYVPPAPPELPVEIPPETQIDPAGAATDPVPATEPAQ
jgi:hypothetical protein